MFNFEGGRLVNKEVELVLQEVQDVMNLVDILARATGEFINFCGDEQSFSENVSQWLFENKRGPSFSAARRLGRDGGSRNQNEGVGAEAGSSLDVDQMVLTEELRERTSHPEFSTFSTYSDAQNLPTSYYRNQLRSNHVSSDVSYRSARSRYLDNQTNQLQQLRERIADINTRPANVSACDIVGPITDENPVNKATKTKYFSPGVAISVKGGSSGNYSSVKSCVDKSKSMFGDFASPSNPNYVTPWDRDRNRRRRGRHYY